jgi:hypothetical protein
MAASSRTRLLGSPGARAVVALAGVLVSFAVVAVGWTIVGDLRPHKDWKYDSFTIATGRSGAVYWTVTTGLGEAGVVCLEAAYADHPLTAAQVDGPETASNSTGECGFGVTGDEPSTSIQLELPDGRLLEAGPLPTTAVALHAENGRQIPARTIGRAAYPLKKYWVAMNAQVDRSGPVDAAGRDLVFPDL